MMWAPINHLSPELSKFGSLKDAADWICSDANGLKNIRYFREILEVLIALNVGDPRVSYLSELDQQVLSPFRTEVPDSLFSMLTQLNTVIAGYGLDDWMAEGKQDKWGPTTTAARAVQLAETSLQLVELSNGRDRIGDCREILEKVVQLKCKDPRARHLSDTEMRALRKFAVESPAKLIEALRKANLRIVFLELDKKLDFTNLVLKRLRPML